MPQKEWMGLLVVMVLAAVCAHGATLATADFTGSTTESEWPVFSNSLGLAFDFPDLLPHLTSDLLQRYLLNSQLRGSWYAVFNQVVHMPPGYKYNCSLLAALTNASVPCLYDLANQTLTDSLGDYIYNTTMWYGASIGWDQQGANFSTDYIKNGFVPYVRALAAAVGQPFMIEIADRADRYGQEGIRANYSVTQMVADCTAIQSTVYGLPLSGPGTTDAADATWYASNSDIYHNCGTFTLRVVVFTDPAKLTIDALLSENYTSQYLKRRMTPNGTSYLKDFTDYIGSITDLRMVEDPMGVPGLTDSFAACIWAIEFAMQFFFLSGYQISLFSTMLAGSKQTVIGPGPTYAPSSLYAAWLLLNLAVIDGPYIDQVTVLSGSSSLVRVYGLDNYYTYGVLILNKDTNASHSGNVAVRIKDQSGFYCVYLTAPGLAATSGVTIAGLQFLPNQSAPVGSFQEFPIAVDPAGYYQVPLNYSQVAYCYTKSAFSYHPFPTMDSSTSNGAQSARLLLVLLLLLLSL